MVNGGFEVLRQARLENAKAAEKALAKMLDRQLREGIPVDLWRCLPDSTGGQ